MFDIQHYGSFIVAILIFQAVPGAGTIAILEATARNGKRAGMAAVTGTLVGDFLFMVAAAAGLAALMQAHPLIFQALQWSGVAYLLWLGVQLLRSRPGADGVEPVRDASPWRILRRALLVSLTNPKVMLFFVAFFPLFLTPQASTATLWAMMLHVTVLSLLYQSALVLIGNLVARRCVAFVGARTVATRLAGLALIGLSIKLASDVR
ncbi:threonine transporter [Achromobacter piechaudii]|uniref:LysE family translocator n=1 Tax=Achromobacter piechaudii TaxID=72556 RepID=UPI00067FE85B|nr:LysE family translocator [Achromobacter piechaudii]KNY11214.1 threonine transporter [Achromobacter piechaudii]